MKLIDGIPVWGIHEENTISQIKTCAKTAQAAALMADGHLGYGVPIGGVVAYEDAISPTGVGFDIACGVKFVRTDATSSEVRTLIKEIMDDIWRTISFGIGRNNNESVDHPIFDKDHPGWDIVPEIQSFKRNAQSQLGTVGSGNHYVDIFEDELARIWIGVHFGSRGMGYKTATYFLKKAGAKDGMDVEPCVLSTKSQIGQDYLATMKLAGEYAYAGRDWVCNRVVKLLGANILEEVHNHHNFAWLEKHQGRDLWVVRKGATPSFPGQKSAIGGSMGDISVIIEGIEHPENELSLCSTVHGAGRVMGRMEAKGKFKNGQVIREPKVTAKMLRDWITPLGVELRGAGVDESPHCYKRLPDVLKEHENSIRVLHTLMPLGVAMASADEHDPFKD